MANLQIMGIQNSKYILINDKSNELIELLVEFYDCPKIKIGDILTIPDILLNKNYKYYIQPYAYERSQKNVEEIKEIDIAYLERGGKRLLLERVYG